MTQTTDMLKVQLGAAADSKSRTLLKTISWASEDGMRVEVWVSSPEPAVGVFTTAGTCQGRLRRHFVIGCAAP